jgi:hypothetical protein
MSPRANVLPLPSQVDPPTRDAAERHEESLPPRLGPIDDMIVVIGDRELDSLAQLFATSPFKQGMTFEAYLAMKGFARMLPKHGRGAD